MTGLCMGFQYNSTNEDMTAAKAILTIRQEHATGNKLLLIAHLQLHYTSSPPHMQLHLHPQHTCSSTSSPTMPVAPPPAQPCVAPPSAPPCVVPVAPHAGSSHMKLHMQAHHTCSSTCRLITPVAPHAGSSHLKLHMQAHHTCSSTCRLITPVVPHAGSSHL